MSLFCFNDTATTEIYTDGHTLSLHDALPIFDRFNGRMARIDAARKRERQRVEHLALGADRPEPELVRPDGLSRQQWKTEKARLRAAGSQLDDPELEARLQIKERWAHKDRKSVV